MVVFVNLHFQNIANSIEDDFQWKSYEIELLWANLFVHGTGYIFTFWCKGKYALINVNKGNF